MADKISVLEDNTLENLKAANILILEMVGNISKAGKISLGSNTPSSSDAIIQKLNKAYADQAIQIQNLQRQLQSYAANQNSANRQIVQSTNQVVTSQQGQVKSSKNVAAASREQSVANQI